MGKMSKSFKQWQEERLGNSDIPHGNDNAISWNIANEKSISELSIWLIEQFDGQAMFYQKELQIILNTGRSTVYNIMNQPDFPFQIVSGRKAINVRSLAAWLLNTGRQHNEKAANQ